MTSKELALKLARAEKEEEIVALLRSLGYWDDNRYWRPFGDNDNNYSIIGSQQSKPDAALVEKFVNSVDAILMKECMIRNIEMTGSDAPTSIADALKRFYGIREGQISYLDSKTRNKMSESIIVAATGSTYHMNITIADKGEGQTPAKMPSTILSVSKNNKLRVPFVQGKFNMGGTGVLPFCGENRFQLVISKRCPDIANADGDSTFNKWSVTIVRRESAREGRRSSMFTYLTDLDQELFSFEADSLPIIPTPNSGEWGRMTYGAYFKLFNYGIQGYKTNVLFDFNYRMSMLLPELAHPIRIRECRSNYQGHSFETTLSGLRTRLDDDRSNNIENDFPSSETFNVDGQNIRCSIYVFKKGRSKNYRESEGILYIVNGQTHATVPDSFFNKVNLSYLADSLLVLVDCSELDVLHREDMFMNSRDRLRNGKFVKEVEDRIKDLLKDHPGLKKLQNERRAAAVQEKLGDDKPLQNVLQSILKKSPVLSKILLAGTRLTAPFNITQSVGEGKVFVGKKHPTFFVIKGKVSEGKLIKHTPINHDFRVQFETDVVNDFFDRPSEKGTLQLKMDGVVRSDLIKHLGLFNGTATLTISMPKEAVVGTKHTFETSIIDDCISNPFENEFQVIIEDPKDYGGGQGGGRENPEDKNKKGLRQNPNEAAMPNVEEKYRSDWDQFEMDKDSALVVYKNEDASDYYLNMDNQYLLAELKGMRDTNRMNLTKARFKFSMALIGLSIESYYKNQEEQDDSVDVLAEIRKISTMIAPILIPMLESMSELDIDEI